MPDSSTRSDHTDCLYLRLCLLCLDSVSGVSGQCQRRPIRRDRKTVARRGCGVSASVQSAVCLRLFCLLRLLCVCACSTCFLASKNCCAFTFWSCVTIWLRYCPPPPPTSAVTCQAWLSALPPLPPNLGCHLSGVAVCDIGQAREYSGRLRRPAAWHWILCHRSETETPAAQIIRQQFVTRRWGSLPKKGGPTLSHAHAWGWALGDSLLFRTCTLVVGMWLGIR